MRGGGRTAGGTRITAILVSATLHLAAAALVIGGGAETPPATPRHTTAITLLPPLAEPEEAAPTPAPPSQTLPPERSKVAPPAEPQVVGAAVPAVLPPAPSMVPPIVQTTPPPPSNDDALRADYARQLWQWIAARRPQGLRLDGEAVVTFRVARDGRLSDIELARSSGSKPLDRLALRTVRLSAPVPAPPEALPDDALRFTLTFHFR